MARKRSLSTVQAALRILAYLAEHPEGVEVKEVARLLGKSLSTAYALLNSLAEEGFAVKTERGYRLGQAKPLRLETTPLEEALEELYLRTRERCYLALLTPEGIRLKTRGRQGQPHPLGDTLPEEVHALALGKVFLAYGALSLPPLVPRTPSTLTDPFALHAALTPVRHSRLAAALAAYAPRLSALPPPLFAPRGAL
ncbi:helix-turn-helix domain-containing protein, partial [Thermus scotoductus]